MRISRAVGVTAIAAGAVVLVLVAGVLAGMHGQTVVVTQLPSSTYTDSPNGLRLRLSINSTSITQEQSLQINISQYNGLATVNNVSASNLWKVDDLALSSCGRDVFPFGTAVYQGNVSAGNVSQATALQVYPEVPCPLFIRLVTGYLFQPMNDSAVVLPGGGSPSPIELSALVTVSGVYSGPQKQAFSPGLYTVVAGDEWGDLAFLYFHVTG